MTFCIKCCVSCPSLYLEILEIHQRNLHAEVRYVRGISPLDIRLRNFMLRYCSTYISVIIFVKSYTKLRELQFSLNVFSEFSDKKYL